MQVPTNLRSGEVGFNMTPMIDVVFLLIIFFLVSSHLAKQEAQMELPLPVADSGEEALDAQKKRLTLNITAEGEMVLAGRRVDRTELQQRLQEARANDADIEVRVRGARSVPYRFVSTVLLACARSGVWNVKLGVYHSEDVR